MFVNEFFILLATYHFYCFTDFMTDVKMRLAVGWSLVGLVLFDVLLCLGIITI